MKSSKQQKKRTATGQQIRHMLYERRDLLALMLQVSDLTHHGKDAPDATLLQEFCELVVDYIAAGHFGLYQRIAEGTERRSRVVEIAGKLYPKIEKTTRIALDFSEKYKIDGKHDRPERFQRDLSELGEMLATRIELEDQLIAAMLNGDQSELAH